MRPYLPNNDTDFSGMVRLVESNGINANNLMTSHLGAGKHCRFPGAAPTTPEEQKLEAAKRNLSRICLLVLSVSTGAKACVCGWQVRLVQQRSRPPLQTVFAAADPGSLRGLLVVGVVVQQDDVVCMLLHAPCTLVNAPCAPLTASCMCLPAFRSSWTSRLCGWHGRAAGPAGAC